MIVESHFHFISIEFEQILRYILAGVEKKMFIRRNIRMMR
jgi:hypothetical protein